MQNVPIKFSYEVEEDKLYAGQYPRDRDDIDSSAKIDQIVNFGITDFIDLTEEDELEPYTQFLPEGIGHYRFPIEDVHVPETMEQLHDILTTIDRLLNSGRKVYVHCWGGTDRTGVIVACWFAFRGLPAEQAFTEYKKRWMTNPKSKMLNWKPLIFERVDYIREYSNWLSTEKNNEQ
jgi:protein-tyrosine phosphatase